jgi:putative transposase
MSVVLRKSVRLDRNEYVGRRICFITICSENRRPIFQNADRARVAIESLKRVSDSVGVFVHAFCLMPDHVHLLTEGKSVASDMVKFVAHWKQSTGYLFRHELPRRFWQRRFYDHVLRRAEDSETVAWYIWMNPVRKGLVHEPQQYPFSGSFTVDWPRSNPPSTTWVPPWKVEEAEENVREGTR